MSSESLLSLQIKTLDQLLETFPIDGDIPLSSSNFSHPIKSYRLHKPEARCQYLRGSKICEQEHLWGYVVRTKEHQNVLIGNCCAEKHLGIEDKTIQQAFSALRKDEARKENLKIAVSFLENKAAELERVAELIAKKDNVLDEAAQLVEALPKRIWTLLSERWKRRNYELNWTYLTHKKVDHKDGTVDEEKYWTPISFKPLSGLGEWLQPRKYVAGLDLETVAKSLQSLPKHSLLTEIEVKAVGRAMKAVASLGRAEESLNRQRQLMSEFRKKDNLYGLVQLTSDHRLRAETLVAVHRIIEEPLQRPAARILSEMDKALMAKYGASGLRLAS